MHLQRVWLFVEKFKSLFKHFLHADKMVVMIFISSPHIFSHATIRKNFRRHRL
jgi:hypothetical protein